MSILQEYEECRRHMGNKKVDAINEYIKYMEGRGVGLFYSDVIYKRVEWEEFERWYNSKYGKSKRRNKKI